MAIPLPLGMKKNPHLFSKLSVLLHGRRAYSFQFAFLLKKNLSSCKLNILCTFAIPI
jgi:hypothetical protein